MRSNDQTQNLLQLAEQMALRVGDPLGSIPESLLDEDWMMGFYCARNDVRAHFCSKVDKDPFNREDVAFVVAQAEGEADEDDWVCFGRLWDGRWFALAAGCSYTGWEGGDLGGGTAFVGVTANEVLNMGISDSNFARLVPNSIERIFARV